MTAPFPPTPRMDRQITAVFDAITNHLCLTYEDIEFTSGLPSTQHVAETLMWIRNPDIADYYGWTIPHVPRGRPPEGQDYRYIVVGTSGSVLSDDDVEIVRTGTLSTTRLVATQTLNLSYALRQSAGLSADKDFKKWCRDAAVILEGVSKTAELEANRVVAILAAVPVAATP